ncbi:MAG TPA: RNA polymerase sigma factor, partial [Solirubrobacteraceae bacterium]|nr:RNA polymerase sigma factor [Solirubrobacteraceae bacterium]
MRAMPGGGPKRPDALARARAAALVRQHHRTLLRIAQHWSATPDDAQDAVQRALEIYMRRIDSLDPETELAWLRVVVKHEALSIRARSADQLPTVHLDEPDDVITEQRPFDDLLAGRERVRRSKETLARLKPDEARALVMKAEGMSYAEIGQTLGWTYTKVNRCITEGRARFLKLYAELEAGETCERFAPTLASLAAGTADADALVELRPHLRNCPACRATVRELHATRLGRLRVLWPIPALVAPLRWLGVGRGETVPLPAPGPDAGDVLIPAPHLGPGEFEPVDLSKLHDAVERMDPTALHAAAELPGRWFEFKAQIYGWLHRMSGTDLVAAAQIGAGTGGGRIATLGAVIGLCLSSLGAGTVCVVTGVLELPFQWSKPPVTTKAERKPTPEPRPEKRQNPRREPKRPLPVAPTPTPSPTP